MSKKKTKKQREAINLKGLIALISCVIACAGLGFGIKITIDEDDKRAVLTYSSERVEAVIEADLGEYVDIPTIEEVDGGKFVDITTGTEITEGSYSDLGWSEWYNTSTPEAFAKETLGKCIVANNVYGAQCVSLARVFWWSYANRDVSTCGTGMAKGMMNCYEQNAGSEFDVYWKDDYRKIQAGDWLVFEGGHYGHVGMALGSVNNGYVSLLGENQGGAACQGGGAATNVINISVKNLIGFYRPKAYIIPEPEPEPEPEPKPTPKNPDTGIVK